MQRGSVRILLPPSETKRLGGVALEGAQGVAMETRLFSHDQLGAARGIVKRALVDLSSGDEDAAAKALKLGVKNRGEIGLNLSLQAPELLPAADRYTGVLYDALAAEELSPSARNWLHEHVYVQSALFGLVHAGDLIPAYRLSGGTRLPELGTTLKKLWSAAHRPIVGEWSGLVLDCRSKEYVALAPLSPGQGVFLNVVQRTEDGQTRALNHFNKAAKGHLVRQLAETQAQPTTREELVEWAAQNGLEMLLDETNSSVTLVTELGVRGT